jgi:hypothetical protein
MKQQGVLGTLIAPNRDFVTIFGTGTGLLVPVPSTVSFLANTGTSTGIGLHTLDSYSSKGEH